MSIYDEYVTAALIGILAGRGFDYEDKKEYPKVANAAFEIANAMIAEQQRRIPHPAKQ